MTVLFRSCAIATAVASAVVTLISASSSPASAAEPGSPQAVVASVDGAQGTLSDIQYLSWTYVAMNLRIKDTSSDGEHAEGRVQTMDSEGTVHSFSWHSAVGYGTAYEDRNAHVSDTRRIQAVRIQVCRKGDDLPDVCDWSSWSWNPYQ